MQAQPPQLCRLCDRPVILEGDERNGWKAASGNCYHGRCGELAAHDQWKRSDGRHRREDNPWL